MKNWKVLSLFLPPFALSACSALVPLPEKSYDFKREPPVQAYARVLQEYVNDAGEVDFPALKQNRADLDYYVAYIARTPFSDFADDDDRLAHYINSYNALSMYNVLDAGIPQTHAGWRKVRFFYLKEFIIGGTKMSFYAYETNIIRKLGDPRAHFALNCSALGCPILPRTPFTGKDLDRELDRETRKFFAEARNLRVDHENKRAYLSEILDFYTEDFVQGDTPNFIAYVNRYAPTSIPEDYTVKFIDYDWTIANSRRTR